MLRRHPKDETRLQVAYTRVLNFAQMDLESGAACMTVGCMILAVRRSLDRMKELLRKYTAISIENLVDEASVGTWRSGKRMMGRRMMGRRRRILAEFCGLGAIIYVDCMDRDVRVMDRQHGYSRMYLTASRHVLVI